ncbi:MAG: hypothetical protein A4E45_00370 [Methanosaeta sp. PtaB.Bin039]|nr:MAG: hypothetical protein A4E45_00370 [Methanosaeta sp. PtaB.Bin039]OPY44421.1 MAG: hypothetical protein A4E47_01576 [Methanosaeta sp. PtaU1.Bin028]HOT06267.1 thioredoxin family protein [Methanotrichaceae archaeon]HQF15708.1 thioredoxin family protein [Methanotrichaceae archaeon]HQI90619.1 thioredoxin family protein [Methanotrichaceae archaeon]
MDMIRKAVFIAPLIAILVLASGLDAIGKEYSLGSENDDWWTTYPDQSTASGGQVAHPGWVLNALKSKPVLIYVHRNCGYCAPQTEAVGNITDEFGGRIEFYEISAESGDTMSNEALKAYDPNGGAISYVPLTVVVTLALDSEGRVVPVWHSSDDVTGEDWIRSYIENALILHGESSAG